MICPKCKAKIEKFRFSSKVEHYGYFQLDNELNEEWDTDDYGEWDNLVFCCPECDFVITQSQEKAQELLIDEEKEARADLIRKYENPREAENQENFCN